MLHNAPGFHHLKESTHVVDERMMDERREKPTQLICGLLGYV